MRAPRSEPKSSGAIDELLGGSGGDFSPKQRILVDFLHRNYQKVAFMNISELARETQVSEATIVRLSTQLKFDGYPGLQKAVQRIVAQELTTTERMRLSLEANDADHPVEQMLKLDVANIGRLHQHLSVDQVARLRDRLEAAKNVLVVGVMSSAPLALYFGYALNRVLRRVQTHTEDNLAAKRAVCELDSRDLLIAFGFPRYPQTVVRFLKSAGERKVYRVAITDTSASPLVRLSEQCLFLPFEMLGFVDSLAAPMSFIAGIVADVVRHRPNETARRLRDFETMAAEFQLFHREE